MSIAIITGSSGLVGSETVNFFCKKGFDVIGIDNNLRKFFFLVKMVLLTGLKHSY